MEVALPLNRLKRALQQGQRQIGLWSSLGSPLSIEIVAGSGFDWLLIDTEHAPNELPMVHSQLQAMSEGTASAVVRVAWNDAVLFKRLLDVGVQSFLVPFVQTADEARRAVAATRYPPQGIRGVASITRSNRFGRVKDYVARANHEICVIVQIETRESLEHIEAIAAVDGIDGLFIGPSDLAAGLGHPGNNGHPEVREAIERSVERILAAGKVAGILAPLEADAKHWIERGCKFVAVGNDAGLLARQSEALAAKFKTGG
jgi:4-hydroxy-2-oxoheptanedioate aldolase